MRLENGGESNMYDGELGDLRFRDRLRMQRDDWKFVMSELSKSEAVNADIHVQAAFLRAKQEYDRIIETLTT